VLRSEIVLEIGVYIISDSNFVSRFLPRNFTISAAIAIATKLAIAAITIVMVETPAFWVMAMEFSVDDVGFGVRLRVELTLDIAVTSVDIELY
jgi:hypothetical protein